MHYIFELETSLMQLFCNFRIDLDILLRMGEEQKGDHSMHSGKRETLFGSDIKIDPTNRLDSLKPTPVPEYITLGRDIRGRLKVKDGEYPAVPEVHGLEDLFDASAKAVTTQWDRNVGGLLNEKYKGWAASLPDTEGYSQVRGLLLNPSEMEKKLRIRQFADLEPLRKVNPDAWRSLLVASSERQLSSVVVMRRWVPKLSEAQLNKIGFTKEELMFVTDIAGLSGKYIDQGFIKQTEYADTPSGSIATPRGDDDGSQFAYELKGKKGKIDIQSYSKMFPFEITRTAARLKLLAGRSRTLLSENKLPPSYRGIPNYLDQMAKVYNSPTKDLARLNDKWDKLYNRQAQMTEGECPLVIVPQSSQTVAGEAEKVDIEIRVAVKTEETRGIEGRVSHYREIAQELVNEHEDALKEPFTVPPPIVTYQPFAFGPNLYFHTPGETGQGSVNTYTNAVRDTAETLQIPLLKKMFPAISIDERGFVHAAIEESVRYELGHAVLSETDDNMVSERTGGTSPEANIAGALKAETVSMVLLDEEGTKGLVAIDAAVEFQAKLGTICDKIANKSKVVGDSSEGYYYSGIATIYELLKSGVIVEQERGYQITDPQKGIKVLADFGRKMIDLYGNDETTPETINSYIQIIKGQKDDAAVQKFVDRLRS